MIRYRLDDLGAYQFEKLIQSLLKGSLGLSVESWGNRKDLGRDAYTVNRLRFPDPAVETDGPFLFQVKFVEGANASGAKPKNTLLNSVAKEIAEIKKRKSIRKWVAPKVFVFITNAQLTSALRQIISEEFANILKSSSIILWGGDDVCDLLDQSPEIYRAFPQLLSIRDLDELIRGVLKSESLVRSAAAIANAKELVPVFVPTSKYEKAWRTLWKHHFAVLEGPPEVGKSAIAWMIGLSQASQGWEAVYSQTPRQFFEMYDQDRDQIFIADDAFGRTEYDPSRTSAWEAELDIVFAQLNGHHWLIWTSRKHILERAVARMDIAGRARAFPDPGTVLVDVHSLSLEERALVLYRHARSSALEAEAKSLIRDNALSIINDPNFTPERIRRFVHSSLPLLSSQMKEGKLSKQAVKDQIAEAIRNPTKQMRLTFRGLPNGLKWYLISFLEISEQARSYLNVNEFKRIYSEYCPDQDRISFEDATEQLQEAFVRKLTPGFAGDRLDWIHPSYRDLVIDELRDDPELRTRFLRRASLEGVKIAVSDTGGATGERNLPFMLSSESWSVLEGRCLLIIANRDQERALLEVLISAASRSSTDELRKRWCRLITTACSAISEKWDRAKTAIINSDLELFKRAETAIGSPVRFPDFEYSWNKHKGAVRRSISGEPMLEDFDPVPVDILTGFVAKIQSIRPEFLKKHKYPFGFSNEVHSLIQIANSPSFELENPDFGEDSSEDLNDKASKLTIFARAIMRLSQSYSDLEDALYKSAERLETLAEGLEEVASERQPDEPEYERNYDAVTTQDADFDVKGLFSEL